MRWQLLWCKLVFSRTTLQDPETSPERSDGILGGNVPLAPVQEKTKSANIRLTNNKLQYIFRAIFPQEKNTYQA